MAVLTWTLAQVDPPVLYQQMMVGRSDVDLPAHHLVSIPRKDGWEAAVASKDLREHARARRGDVQDDEDRGREFRRHVADQFLEGVDTPRGSAYNYQIPLCDWSFEGAVYSLGHKVSLRHSEALGRPPSGGWTRGPIPPTLSVLMRDGRMHQTTVRFGPDLWAALELECAQLGVSAAHYLREAALARLTYAAGRRGDLEYERALASAGAASTTLEPLAVKDAAGDGAESAQIEALESKLNATAVIAQNEVAMRQARAIRARSLELRQEYELLLDRQKAS
jgi:hypothetical protein